MREREGTHFEERREREMKSNTSQDILSLRKSLLQWELACNPRRNNSFISYSVRTAPTVRSYNS